MQPGCRGSHAAPSARRAQAFRTTIYSELLAIQDDIMLRTMKLVTQAGSG